MAEADAGKNDNLLWAILAITVVAGLGNALMINSMSQRIDALGNSAVVEDGELPNIRPVSGTVEIAATHNGPKAPVNPHAKAKTKAKAKSKAGGGGGGGAGAGTDAARKELNLKIDGFVSANGIEPTKKVEIKKHVNACYDALNRINSAAKSGKIDKAQRQKRMLGELKKRDAAVVALIGEEMGKKLKREVLAKD